MKKNLLLLPSVATFALISFFGCGGESVSTLSSEKAVATSEVSDSTKRDTSLAISKNFQLLLDQIHPVQSNVGSLMAIGMMLSVNMPINYVLEYNNSAVGLYHAVLKLDNNKPSRGNFTFIGESFIYIDPSKANPEIELLTQVLDYKANVPKNDVNNIDLRVPATFNKIWHNPTEASIIIDSLKNNPFNALQNSKYTVSFTLQETANKDFQFSDIKISGLNLLTDHFVLTKDQFRLDPADLFSLQSLLTTLFANFDKSKVIFK